MIKRSDTPMHRVRLEVPTDCGQLLENLYETYTLRRYYLGRIPVWCRDINVERRPMHEFIKACIG